MLSSHLGQLLGIVAHLPQLDEREAALLHQRGWLKACWPDLGQLEACLEHVARPKAGKPQLARLEARLRVHGVAHERASC